MRLNEVLYAAIDNKGNYILGSPENLFIDIKPEYVEEMLERWSFLNYEDYRVIKVKVIPLED